MHSNHITSFALKRVNFTTQRSSGTIKKSKSLKIFITVYYERVRLTKCMFGIHDFAIEFSAEFNPLRSSH